MLKYQQIFSLTSTTSYVHSVMSDYVTGGIKMYLHHSKFVILTLAISSLLGAPC
jgi:hypothetical protein